MEINGQENYSKWINKNFIGLNKRTVLIQPPTQNTVIKIPYLRNRSQTIQLLKQETVQRNTSKLMTIKDHTIGSGTFYTQHEEDEEISKRKGKATFKYNKINQDQDDPLLKEKHKIVKLLNILENSPQLAERDLGISRSRHKLAPNKVLQAILEQETAYRKEQSYIKGIEY